MQSISLIIPKHITALLKYIYIYPLYIYLHFFFKIWLFICKMLTLCQNNSKHYTCAKNHALPDNVWCHIIILFFRTPACKCASRNLLKLSMHTFKIKSFETNYLLILATVLWCLSGMHIVNICTLFSTYGKLVIPFEISILWAMLRILQWIYIHRWSNSNCIYN